MVWWVSSCMSHCGVMCQKRKILMLTAELQIQYVTLGFLGGLKSQNWASETWIWLGLISCTVCKKHYSHSFKKTMFKGCVLLMVSVQRPERLEEAWGVVTWLGLSLTDLRLNMELPFLAFQPYHTALSAVCSADMMILLKCKLSGCYGVNHSTSRTPCLWLKTCTDSFLPLGGSQSKL